MGDPLNLSSILSEMMDVNDVVGCGFGDRNGLTLVLEGQISRLLTFDFRTSLSGYRHNIENLKPPIWTLKKVLFQLRIVGLDILF